MLDTLLAYERDLRQQKDDENSIDRAWEKRRSLEKTKTTLIINTRKTYNAERKLEKFDTQKRDWTQEEQMKVLGKKKNEIIVKSHDRQRHERIGQIEELKNIP